MIKDIAKQHLYNDQFIMLAFVSKGDLTSD